MSRSKKSSPVKPVTADSTPTASPIDYRTLVKRSRYDQIELELAKLKARLAALEEHHRAKTPCKSIGTETKRSELGQTMSIDSARLGQALVNIEDDLHRILYILLHQFELFHRRRHAKHSKTLAIDTATDNSKLKKESRTTSQPNLFRHIESQPIAQSPKSTFSHNAAAPGSKSRSRSSERRKSSPGKPTEPQTYHGHYHITRPDVHWVLGTSPTPSYSLMARKQLQLAALKQHGPLCLRHLSHPAAVEYSKAPEERSRVIRRVQAMISELQLEYDRLYRKLQFQQTFDDQSEESSVEIPRLSNHLIHIMDQLVELHQLNKSFLC